MSEGNYLFDMNQLVQRPIPEQRAFEMHYFNLLVRLPVIFQEAFEITRREMRGKPPLSINRSWFANTMNGNVVSLVGAEFPNYLRSTGRGSYCLFLDSRYEGYFKKLSPNGMKPYYNHSRTSRALTNQQAFPHQDPIPIIYLGYTMSPSSDMLTGKYATCIKGSETLWRTDLTAIDPPMALPRENSPVQPTGDPLVTIKAIPQVGQK